MANAQKMHVLQTDMGDFKMTQGSTLLNPAADAAVVVDKWRPWHKVSAAAIQQEHWLCI